MHAVVFDDLAPRLPAGATEGDRCPGTLRLHEAADGWLARVRIPGGRLTVGQLKALADLAASQGNGLVDLTSRANVQLRGLRGDPSAAIAAAGLLPAPAHERVRNVLASPLAGRDPRALVDGARLGAALDRAICADLALTALSGRFQFAVEDGSGLLAAADADLLLEAVAPGVVRLVAGGVAQGEAVEAAAGPARATAAARAFLARADGAWRIPRQSAAAPPAAQLELGRFTQADGGLALTALVPLGRLDARQLRGLAGLGRELRVSPWRTVTLVDADAADEHALRALGLILDGASGWRGLTACAGLGACPRARLDVRAAAGARARRRRAGDPPEHWSACPRRCGAPRGAAASVTWTEDGVRADGLDPADLRPALEAAA